MFQRYKQIVPLSPPERCAAQLVVGRISSSLANLLAFCVVICVEFVSVGRSRCTVEQRERLTG